MSLLSNPMALTALRNQRWLMLGLWVEYGSLLALEIDGCQAGHKDKGKKPSFYLTTVMAAQSIFSECVFTTSTT